MRTLYIKFRHQNDIYALYPDYDLSPDDFVIPKICARCGENLYLPVEFPECANIVQPLPNVIRPKERFLTEPEPILIEFTPHNKLPYYEKQRIKSFVSVSYVGESSWAMLVEDVSRKYIEHHCNDLLSLPS